MQHASRATVSRTRRGALAVVLAVAVPFAAACGAGFDATTQKFYAPADGVYEVKGATKILNVLLVAPPQGSTEGVVSMTVVNDTDQPDTIVAIEAGQAGRAEIRGPREVPARGALSFGGPSAESSAVIPNFSVRPGDAVTMSVTLQRAGVVPNITTVVVPAGGFYHGFQVAPTRSGTPQAGEQVAAPTPGATVDGRAGPAVPKPLTPAPAPGH